jgi:hypothetical protein
MRRPPEAVGASQAWREQLDTTRYPSCRSFTCTQEKKKKKNTNDVCETRIVAITLAACCTCSWLLSCPALAFPYHVRNNVRTKIATGLKQLVIA